MIFGILVATALFWNVLASRSNKCPDGYVLNAIDTTCIKVHEQPIMSYDQALKTCQNENNGILAQPRNILSTHFVSGLLIKGKRYWVGLKKNSDGGVFYLNGNRVLFEPPRSWREPGNHEGDDANCVEMVGCKISWWNDIGCDKERAFVCQTKAGEVNGRKLYPISYAKQMNGNRFKFNPHFVRQ